MIKGDVFLEQHLQESESHSPLKLGIGEDSRNNGTLLDVILS